MGINQEFNISEIPIAYEKFQEEQELTMKRGPGWGEAGNEQYYFRSSDSKESDIQTSGQCVMLQGCEVGKVWVLQQWCHHNLQLPDGPYWESTLTIHPSSPQCLTVCKLIQPGNPTLLIYFLY